MLLGWGAPATERVEVLEDLVAGTQIVVPALLDPWNSGDEDQRIIAMPYHYGYQLSGTRTFVPYAPDADAFLVDASTADGSIMVIIPAGVHGVDVKTTETVDGVRYGTVTFSEASTMSDELLIASAKQGKTLTAACYDRLLLCAAAEMLGVMGKALDMAVEYLKTREQFGKPIGEFPGAPAPGGGRSYRGRTGPVAALSGLRSVRFAPRQTVYGGGGQGEGIGRGSFRNEIGYPDAWGYRVYRRIRRRPVSEARHGAGGSVRQCRATPESLRCTV